jgi:hypothetical protein
MNKRYPSVGRCIYCRSAGTSAAPLTDEHVIAYALAGNLVLPKASCVPCATITGRFEQTCIKQSFGLVRGKHGLPTRRKKERRIYFPLHYGSNLSERRVHFSSHPFVVALPSFGSEPWLLDSKPHGNTTLLVVTDKAARRRAALPVSYSMLMDFDAFYRMLAKIAHSFAVAEYGIDSFIPFLIELIIHGKGSRPTDYYIGSPPQPAPTDRASTPSHQLGIDFIGLQHGAWIGVVTIRLFAHLRAPRYHVVVGEFPDIPNAA